MVNSGKPVSGSEDIRRSSIPRRRLLEGSVASAIALASATERALAADDTFDLDIKLLSIAKQGSFFVGGRTVKGAGEFNPSRPVMPSSDLETFWVNQMYVNYQLAPNPRQYPIVFWHGGGLTGSIWESTPDGRPGFQSIFLQNGYSVYTLDQPGRGRGSLPMFNGPFGSLQGSAIVPNATARFGIEGAWVRDRLGPEPRRFFPGVQFPQDHVDDYFKEMGGNPVLDTNEIVEAAAALFDSIGPAILVTHSASGVLGLRTAARSPNVKAILAFEPATSLFPLGEIPTLPGLAEGTIFPPAELQREDFRKLARIPIQLVFGDNIPDSPTPEFWFMDWWRVTRLAQGEFVTAVNRLGGDAGLLNLPDIGLRGNTHFPFTDLNNREVAQVMSRFLQAKQLDRRAS